MRFLVTRPDPDGERTAAQLRARGCDVMLAPLLRVEAIQAELDDGAWGAIALTSANALRAVAGHSRLAALLPLPTFAVGRRTAEAARDLGFANVVSADGDAKDLVRLIGEQHGSRGPLLYLAGEDRAADLAGELAAAGVEVRTKVVYRATAAAEFPADARDALAAGRIDGVLHFSRRSAEAYVDCARAGGILGNALALSHYCLSRQVAEPLVAAGAAAIRVAGRPRETDLIDLATA